MAQYQQRHTQLQQLQQQQQQQQQHQTSSVDFLPVCDLLFNLVSVTAYFCDVAFAAIVAYSLLADERDLPWFCVVFLSGAASVLICQVLSLRWIIEDEQEQDGSSSSKSSSGAGRAVSVALHFCLCGVLWRYARLLFLPIDMALVKREMRNLSILRLVHALVQSLACLLAQGYLLATRGGQQDSTSPSSPSPSSPHTPPSSSPKPLESPTVYVASSCLALLSLCWALASFNKHIRRADIHRLTLTWMGVLCQLLWRLGTVGSRCLALVLYASVYHGWVFLFALLHWVCMLTWLVMQSNHTGGGVAWDLLLPRFCLRLQRKRLSEEDDGGLKKKEDSDVEVQQQRPFLSPGIKRSLVLSYVYMVDYVNLDDASSSGSNPPASDTRLRMGLYYAVALIENVLLASLWSSSVRATLVHTAGQRRDAVVAVVAPFVAGIALMLVYYRVFHVARSADLPFYRVEQERLRQLQQQQQQQQQQQLYLTDHRQISNGHAPLEGGEGGPASAAPSKTVFNCALNPAMKKRKKIPRTIPIPPPPSGGRGVAPGEDGGRDPLPFWKRPLPAAGREAEEEGEDSEEEEEEEESGEEQQQHYYQQQQQQQQQPFPRADLLASGLRRPLPPPLPPLGHDSSGDQGDIDSAEDADWQHQHQHHYDSPSYPAYANGNGSGPASGEGPLYQHPYQQQQQQQTYQHHTGRRHHHHHDHNYQNSQRQSGAKAETRL